MKLCLRSTAEAVSLLVEYNRGRNPPAAEERLIRDGKKLAAADFERLGFERYYRESEAIKYDLLDWHLHTRRWQADFQFLPHLVRPGSLLDFGAGIGLSSFAYASAGFSVTAVEAALDSDTVRFARFLAGRLGVKDVTFTDRIPEGPVDNIVCIDVFEHFPDWTRPARALAAILRPGGAFAITAPFGNHQTDPDHPQHFDSPVPVVPFLVSLGLRRIAPGVWRKEGS